MKTISTESLKDAFSKSIAIGRIIRWHFGDGESEDKAVDEIEAHINAIIDQQPQAYAPPANEQPMSDWVRMVDAKKLASAIDRISEDDCWKGLDAETAFNEAVSMCKQAVLKAPTVSAYGSWMDARTNPPDDDREVLVMSNGEVTIGCKYDNDWVQYLPDEDGDLIPHIIPVQYWMEKPEPPKACSSPAVYVLRKDDDGVIWMTDDGKTWYRTDPMPITEAVCEADRYYVRLVGAFDTAEHWSAVDVWHHFPYELYETDEAPDFDCAERIYDLATMSGEECQTFSKKEYPIDGVCKLIKRIVHADVDPDEVLWAFRTIEYWDVGECDDIEWYIVGSKMIRVTLEKNDLDEYPGCPYYLQFAASLNDPYHVSGPEDFTGCNISNDGTASEEEIAIACEVLNLPADAEGFACDYDDTVGCYVKREEKENG